MIVKILGLAAILAAVLWSLLLFIKPGALKILRPLVCRKDEKLEFLFSVASYHQPGEKSIEIYCNNYGNRRLVNGKTLLLAFLLSFVVMFPLAILIVALLDKFQPA